MTLLLYVAGGAQFRVIAQASQDESRVEKVKKDVAKRGTGTKARVKVKLGNGSKLKGYISQARDDSFTLTDPKTGQSTTLAYSDVTEVTKQGGLSIGAKIGIGVAIGVGALAIIYLAGCGGTPYC